MGKVPKVTLMIQCKVDGVWKKPPAPMSANGRPKNVPGASFYLRYRRKGKDTWEPVEGEGHYYMFNQVRADRLTGLLEVGELTC